MTFQDIIMTLLPLLGMMNLFFHMKNFLLILLSFEVISLSLVIFVLYLSMMKEINNPIIVVMLLTTGVCEASLGLSLLVIMSRNYGNDQMKSVTSSKC